MICYAFPLAHEAAPFLQLCTQKESFSIGSLHCTLAQLRERRVLVALIGLGSQRARANAEAILAHFRPQAIVLSGYGGALVPQLSVGNIVISSNFTSSDVLTYLRILSGYDFGIFCTADEIAATRAARDRAARTAKAQVVEMETAPVASLANSREIPFVAVRVISDDYAQELPVRALAAGFDAARGKPTPLRLLRHLALHPREIKPFRKFVAGLDPARRKLAQFLQLMNDELPRNW